jgi:diketogulonate reductase-like aldo/keto reductase
MNHKELGQTAIRLPEVGLGTYEYQGGIGPLRTGIGKGAFLIDTAEGYGTEETVGLAIKGIRNQVFLATKVSPQNFKRSDLLNAANKSLQRLGTDHIDLYQLHFPNHKVPIEETMGAMEELVDMGKVRFIGVSNFSVPQLKKAQASLRKYKIASNQIRYSLVDRRIEFGLLRYCEVNQITVIAYSPLARGIDNLRKKDYGGSLGKVAAATGKTEAQVAINWCLSKQPVIALVKANSIPHTVENCLASGWRLPAIQIRLLEESIKFPGPIEVAFRQTTRRVLHRLGFRF